MCKDAYTSGSRTIPNILKAFAMRLPTCQMLYILPFRKTRKGKRKPEKVYCKTLKHSAMFFYSFASGHLISSALKVISFKHGSLRRAGLGFQL